MNTTTSPIHVSAQHAHPVCLACTKAERHTVLTTDAVSHVRECHPEATQAVLAQFAPIHHKIVRSAR